MSLRQSHIEAMAVAILAVNGFSSTKVMSIVPRLKVRQLLTPAYVAALEMGALTAQLFESGYERGALTSMFAERLQGLMIAIHEGDLDAVQDLVSQSKKDETIQLLLRLRGVGPKVATTAWTLMIENNKGATSGD